MKKKIFLIAVCLGLLMLGGCTRAEHDGNASTQISSTVPNEGREEIKEILYEQIRLYEYGCYGLEYQSGEENDYLYGFAAMYCQDQNIAYGPDSDRQSLIRLGTEEYFNITYPEDEYFSDSGIDDTILSIQPIETATETDRATVVVQRQFYGRELFDNRYTFVKAELPQSFKGTIFEQLSHDNAIWKIEKVELLREPAPAETIEIGSAEGLIQFVNDVNSGKPEAVNGSFVLTADIDLSGNSAFQPIGLYNEEETYNSLALALKSPMGFNGSFDGMGHTISGFELNEKARALGFFRVLNDDAVIKNLHLQGSVTNGYMQDMNCRTGGFAGLISTNARVENCSFTGTVDGYAYVGGFTGAVKWVKNTYNVDDEGFMVSGDGLIKNCTSHADVSAAYYAGGFAGGLMGNLDDCTANGEVLIAEKYGGIPSTIGGFCGQSSSEIRNCHCNVKVTHYIEGANRMGNFVGELMRKNIVNCTIQADVVNPDWLMVGHKDYLSATADIEIVNEK